MEQMDKNEKIILADIFNAIKTYQAGKGEVETVGIVNAFARSMKEDKYCLILFQKVMKNGKPDKAFVMMKDKAGRTLFPLFTDRIKAHAVKKSMGEQGQVEVGVMNLKMVITMLAAMQMCDGIMVNPFIQNFNAPLTFFTDILEKEPKSHITLIEAEYTGLHVGTAVCPTDEKISGVSGVDSELQSAGGEAFQAAISAELQNENLGVAEVIAVQGSGNIRSKYVLFTNVPEYSAQMKLEELFESYLNCMNAAKDLKSTSIAFPCSSEAMKGMPMEMIIGASTKAVTTWLAANADYKIDIYFCCKTKEEKELYQKFFDGIRK